MGASSGSCCTAAAPIETKGFCSAERSSWISISVSVQQLHDVKCQFGRVLGPLLQLLRACSEANHAAGHWMHVFPLVDVSHSSSAAYM